MNQQSAVAVVKEVRQRIVTAVGTGSREVSDINEVLERLEQGKCKPETAVLEAQLIRTRIIETC